LPADLRFLAYDGTSLECPGATSTDYRLHLGIDLSHLRFHDIHISDTKTGESLKHYPLGPGDVAVADQGYCSYAGIFDAVHRQGADVIVRWNHQRWLYHPEKRRQPLDLCHELRDLKPGTTTSMAVRMQYAHSKRHPVQDTRELAGYLHVYRMTPAEAQAAGKRVGRKRQRKQKRLSAKTAFLSAFVLVFTSLSPERVSPEMVLALYRCRWQIELAIKRMKSVLHLDKMRAKAGSQLAEVYLYGKVLYVLLVDDAMRRTFGDHWGQWTACRSVTPWRFYKLLKARFDTIILAQGAWKCEAVPDCVHVMMERPRQRKLQCLSRRIVDLGLHLNHLPHAA
jgi:hypothetical protein